jgi:4-amino-4-deoxy-L-arabinose transferase-like glycosyltransferase
MPENNFTARALSKIKEASHSTLAQILFVAASIRLVGLTWGLPASDGWDNDGIAPRDFLPGLIETFTPGHYFTYPPAQFVLLTLISLPVTIVLLIKSPSLAPSAVIAEAVKVPYMTAFAVIARGVSIAMSIGIIYAVAKIVELAFGRRASLLAAAACSMNVILTYYGQTTNLDVPYLFWASLSLLMLARTIALHEPKLLRRAAIFAALSVATKDQAYALFVLGLPIPLVLWAFSDRWVLENKKIVARELLISAAMGVALLLFVDGAVVNPSGFHERVKFLTGPASQPYAYYSADARGRVLAAFDSVAKFESYYPIVFVFPLAFGFFRAFRVPERSKRVVAFVPFFAIVSFTIFFNCIARRTEHRFLLPQMTLWAAYVGVGCDLLLSLGPEIARRVFRVALAIAAMWGAFLAIDVEANLILDPRYDAENYLREHVAPGDVIEVHGKNVYLPRFPAKAHVIRIGMDPVGARNPLPGVEEKEDSFTDLAKRAPRWIVVDEGYGGQILRDAYAGPTSSGRVFSQMQIATSKSADVTTFFQGLVAGKLGYKRVHLSTWESTFWPRLDIHASTARDVWIFAPDSAPESKS